MLMNIEGVRGEVYRDSSGIPTVGVGHVLTQSERSSGKIYLTNGDVVDFRSGMNHAEIMNLMLDDVSRFEDAVERSVKVSLEQYQFDALVSFAFNIGEPAFEKSTLLKLLNKGAYEQVPAQIRRWNKTTIGGRKVVVKGLENRRDAEVSMWEGQNPSGNIDGQEQRPDEYTTTADGETLPVWNGSGDLVPIGSVIQHEQENANTSTPNDEMTEFLRWREDRANSKPTAQSKILGAVGAMIASALLARYGLDLPPGTVEDVLTWIVIGGGSLIAYFRKFKTIKPKLS